MKAVNGSKEARGLFCQLYDNELNKYIMNLVDNFFETNPTARTNPMIATQTHGRQADGKTWVLNEEFQIDQDGDEIEGSKYLWIEEYFPSNKEMALCRSNLISPLKPRAFETLLKKLKSAIPGKCL